MHEIVISEQAEKVDFLSLLVRSANTFANPLSTHKNYRIRSEIENNNKLIT